MAVDHGRWLLRRNLAPRPRAAIIPLVNQTRRVGVAPIRVSRESRAAPFPKDEAFRLSVIIGRQGGEKEGA